MARAARARHRRRRDRGWGGAAHAVSTLSNVACNMKKKLRNIQKQRPQHFENNFCNISKHNCNIPQH
jgi:hypothetical protein